jgi:hypothetical protein
MFAFMAFMTSGETGSLPIVSDTQTLMVFGSL